MSLVPTAGWRTMPNFEIAKEHGDYYLSMGLTAEEVAKDFKVSREDQDAFAFRSHQRALEAIKQGRFKDGILPVTVKEVYLDKKNKRAERSVVVDTDEGPRADTSIEQLAKLPAVFAAGGSVTAGNSSQTSDGAAFTIVMSDKMATQLGLVPKVLKQAGMTLSDINLIELNEAFASQSLAVIRELGLDEDKVNVNGGAISLGHPLGCTGAKLTVQILNDLKRTGGKFGMVTACIGGGQGIAGLIERF